MTTVPADGPTIDEVEQKLYSVPPADFVALRDQLVAQAREHGDAVLAKQVAALRKPTAGAWLANLLCREHPDQVADLVALGGALREAQAGLDPAQLRELSQQRHKVVGALVGLARRTAAEQGHPVGAGAAEDLEGTLTAALADPAAADALMAGRLVHGLSYAGLGDSDAVAQSRTPQAAAGKAAAGRKAAAPRPNTAEAKEAARAAKVDAAERDLAQSRLQAAAAQAEAESAQQAAQEATVALRDARADVSRLRGELDAAERAVTARESERETAVREKVRTARLASGAAKEAEAAAKALHRLTSG